MLVASTKLTPVYWRFSFTEDCKRGTSILDIRVIISSPDEQAMQAIQPRMAFCCQGHCWLMLSLLPAGVSGLFLQTCSPFRQSQSGKGLGTSFFFLIFFFYVGPFLHLVYGSALHHPISCYLQACCHLIKSLVKMLNDTPQHSPNLQSTIL